MTRSQGFLDTMYTYSKLHKRTIEEGVPFKYNSLDLFDHEKMQDANLLKRSFSVFEGSS